MEANLTKSLRRIIVDINALSHLVERKERVDTRKRKREEHILTEQDLQKCWDQEQEALLAVEKENETRRNWLDNEGKPLGKECCFATRP